MILAKPFVVHSVIMFCLSFPPVVVVVVMVEGEDVQMN